MTSRSLRASTVAQQQQRDISPGEAEYSPGAPAAKRAKTTKSSTTASNKANNNNTPNNSKSSSPIKAQAKPNSSKSSTKPTIKITEETGDIFTAPPGTLLIHACNCEGSWGAGIAAAFKAHYPAAFEVYKSHCDEHGHELIGGALLIPPHGGDTTTQKGQKQQHFVGCLFTSRSKGKKKDAPGAILAASGKAMRELIRQVEEFNANAKDGDGKGEVRVTEVRMCKINSGLFAVPWEKTKAALGVIEVEEGSVLREVKVIDRPS